MPAIYVCVFIYVYVFMCVSSVMCDCATPWTIARQSPLSMGFSRQEYWSGLPRPPPGDLPDPGVELTSLMSPALAGSFFSATQEVHLKYEFSAT